MLAAMMSGGPKLPSPAAPGGAGDQPAPRPSTSAAPKPTPPPAPKELSSASKTALEAKLASASASGPPNLTKYKMMQKAGLPDGAVRQAMQRDGVDPSLLFS